jgi:hypothetical protein
MRLILLSTVVLSAGIFGVGLAGCGESKPATSATASETKPKAAVGASFFASDRPADVKDLKAVRDGASKGDTVTFLARVGGRRNPFTDAQAIFVVTDPTLESCEIMADDDHCSAPWDYCCEDPDNLKMNVATVRFLDDGRPIRTNAKSAGGLDVLKFVVVTGTVNDINDEGLFIVDADSVWVGGKPKFGEPRLGSK